MTRRLRLTHDATNQPGLGQCLHQKNKQLLQHRETTACKKCSVT